MTQADPQPAIILIVDDHAAIRELLRDHLLSAHPECVVLDAADGATALAICRQHRPRIVLMDVGLPDADGIELCARFRALEPGMEVIIVSHHVAGEYVGRARAAGAFAYVAKDRIFHELTSFTARALAARAVS
jgi:two-component system response regulator EvgA